MAETCLLGLSLRARIKVNDQGAYVFLEPGHTSIWSGRPCFAMRVLSDVKVRNYHWGHERDS